MKNNNDVAMTWSMKWLNGSVTTMNVMLQLLDIYIYIYIYNYKCFHYGTCIYLSAHI